MTSSTECVKVIRSATLIMNQLSSRYTFNMEIIASPLCSIAYILITVRRLTLTRLSKIQRLNMSSAITHKHVSLNVYIMYFKVITN